MPGLLSTAHANANVVECSSNSFVYRACAGILPAPSRIGVRERVQRASNHGQRHYETDECFRHLGASGEQIAEAKRRAKERGPKTVPDN